MAGETDKAKGRAKKATGELLDDKDLKREGQADEAAGKTKETAEKVRDRVDEAVDDIREKFRSS